jgi:hypothetical protein
MIENAIVRNKLRMIIFLVIAVFLLLTAESCNGGTSADESATDRQLGQYQKTQPIPFHDWSQYRATLISVDEAQAKGTATTSFFFLAGRQDPIRSCDSIGYPVPSTAQLTNPDQVAYSSSGAVIGQMEPTGVYTGDSQGTYVVCLVQGKAVPTYWEGEVETEGGPAKWDKAQSMIVSTGPGTVETKRR